MRNDISNKNTNIIKKTNYYIQGKINNIAVKSVRHNVYRDADRRLVIYSHYTNSFVIG